MSKNNKPSRWKKLKMWFWSKSRTLDEILKISDIAEFNVNKILKNIESLSQNRIYVCIMKDSKMHDIMTAKDIFERVSLRMKWTPPKILFFNKEIRLMSDSELNRIIKLNKKGA